MLTFNACYTLQLTSPQAGAHRVSEEAINQAVRDLGEINNSNALDLQQYIAWFQRNVMYSHGT